MNISANKILANRLSATKTKATLALFLALTVAASTATLSVASAHAPALTIPTWTYISVTNSVIGINQELTIVYWLNAVPPTAVGAYGDRWAFTIEVTKPDGSEETLGPFTSDPVGGGWATYTPTQVGMYTFVAKFAEHTITGTPVPPEGYFFGGDAAINDTYEASESDPAYVTVQETAIEAWSEAPLPTQFWTRPINSANRDWSSLAGNWLACAAQNVNGTIRYAYGEGPESAHIMWATPMWTGGIMDARYGDTGYSTSDYEGLNFLPPIILNGKIYYNVQSLPIEGWYCLDLYTGEVEYFHNTTGAASGQSDSSSGSISGESLAFGQIYNYESPNQHGGKPYLWSTNGPTANTWMMFDAYSGSYICSIKNVPSWVTYGSWFVFGTDTSVYGEDGSILAYNIVNYGTAAVPNYYLQCWNSSRAIWYRETYSTNSYWLWRPGLNVTYDGNNGYSLNASIPVVQGSILAIRENQYVIGGTSGKNNGTYVQQGQLWALNLKPASDGTITPTLLWNITYTPPESVADIAVGGVFSAGGMSGPTVNPENGVFLFNQAMTRQWWCYDLETGQQLWESDSEAALNYYGMMSAIHDGKLFSYGYGGQLIAYDIQTGDVLWTYNASQVGYESPYGNYPLFLDCIADGKLYMYSSEHSPTQPLWRGSYVRCINASNGAELWKMLDWDGGKAPALGGNVGCGVIADGYFVDLNLYDNQIYCIGKGPSATTVEAPMTAITEGDSVVIRGTVTDQCAGAKALVEKMGFTNGVAAVSDDSMEAWMEYLYEQQAIPTNATGVEVTLDAVDPNGNFVHIGTATSDMSGTYSYMWETPEVPGKYTVIATFAGSASYYSSYAETAMGVSEAPAATAPPEYPQPIDTTWTIVGVGIAMIIAVAIVGLLILRKK